MRTNWWIFASVLVVAAPLRAANPPAPLVLPATIELYVRKAGSPPSREATVKENPKVVDLDKEPLESVRLTDIQYDGAQRFRAVRLGLIISRYAPPGSTDLAILHFANGMAVPLPFRDDRAMKRLSLYVARGILPEATKETIAPLPAISRKVENYVDVKPIVFGTNKLVVGDRWHPAVPEREQAALSPWMFVDSLTAIEFVSSAAYFRQFEVNTASHESREGLAVFMRSCQFCHGARKLGASFGWDFVEPLPITEVRRSPRALFFHVAYRAKSEQQAGVLMPALQYIDEDDARVLYQWLRDLPARPMPAYAPPAP